jgi:hypothetical protein
MIPRGGKADVCHLISLSLADLSPLNPPPGDHLLVVLKSYFDGSNHADSSEYDRISIATVCGTGKQWKRFETEWKRVLYRHRADYLHTTDAVSLQNDFTREKGWNKTRVDSFIGDCVEVIEKQITIPTGFGVNRPRVGLYPVTLTIPFSDWLIAKRTVPELPDTIEELCATESFGFAVSRGRDIGARKYELHFDRGEPFFGYIHNRWEHPKAKKDITVMKDVISISQDISRYVPALQMADLLAWGINRANQETREWHKRLHSLPYRSALLDYEHLIKPRKGVLETVASWKLPPRKSSVKNLSKPKRVR